MENKTVLITGATGGIGKAAAVELAKQGFTVILHGRDAQKVRAAREEIVCLTGNTQIDTLVADLFSMNDVRRLAETFREKYGHLDVLINNAGGILHKKRAMTQDGFETTMAVNVLAPFLLTELLLDLLVKSPDGRIVNVASNAHQLNAKPDFRDLQLEKGYNPLRAYGNAKLFLIWNTFTLADRLGRQGVQHVTVNTLHPGAVRSNFGINSNLGPLLNVFARLARPFFKTVEQGAETIVYLASSEDVRGVTGKYFVDRQPAKVSEKYFSPERQQQVWEYCEEQLRTFIR